MSFPPHWCRHRSEWTLHAGVNYRRSRRACHPAFCPRPPTFFDSGLLTHVQWCRRSKGSTAERGPDAGTPAFQLFWATLSSQPGDWRFGRQPHWSGCLKCRRRPFTWGKLPEYQPRSSQPYTSSSRPGSPGPRWQTRADLKPRRMQRVLPEPDRQPGSRYEPRWSQRSRHYSGW